MSISVVIPTYGRPNDLLRCLRALENQDTPAREVIVVRRKDDLATAQALAGQGSAMPLIVEVVDARQQSLAMNVGIAAATSAVVALTDDDAVPHPDWISRLEAHFAHARVGGVGGRDRVHTPAGWLQGRAETVGRVTWYGRCIGNHHLGVGSARDVDFLKGVNLSVRRDLWHLDDRLQGSGIQTHWEIGLSLGIRRRGLRLIYDPQLLVDHYPSPLGPDDRPSRRTPEGVRHAAHNEALGLLRWLPVRRGLAALGYEVLVGSTVAPGVLRSLIALLRWDLDAARLLPAVLAGRIEAAASVLRAGRGQSKNTRT